MHSHGSHTQIEAMRVALSPKVQARRAEAEIQHQAARLKGAEMMSENEKREAQQSRINWEFER